MGRETYALQDADSSIIERLGEFKQIGSSVEENLDTEMLGNIISNIQERKNANIPSPQQLVFLTNAGETPGNPLAFAYYLDSPSTQQIEILKLGLQGNVEQMQKSVSELITLLVEQYPQRQITFTIPESDSKLLEKLDPRLVAFQLEQNPYGEDRISVKRKPQLTQEVINGTFQSYSQADKIRAVLRKLNDATGVEWRVGKIQDEDIKKLDMSPDTLNALKLYQRSVLHNSEYVLFTESNMINAEERSYGKLGDAFAEGSDLFNQLYFKHKQHQQVVIPLQLQILRRIMFTPLAVGELADAFKPQKDDKRYRFEAHEEMNDEQSNAYKIEDNLRRQSDKWQEAVEEGKRRSQQRRKGGKD